MIKAIIFDFFGVLVTEGFKNFQEQYFHNDADKRQKSLELINKVDSGKISMGFFTSQLANLAGISTDDVDSMLGNNQPNKALLDFISADLAGKYKLGILSNSSMDFPSRLLPRQDVKLFDEIILSYKYKMVKPQPEIYQLTSEKLKVSNSECIFIDDSISHVNAAAAVGMKGILYKDFPSFKKELTEILSSVSDK